MAEDRLNIPAMPSPPEAYDQENEVAFRRQVSDLALHVETMVQRVGYSPCAEMFFEESTEEFDVWASAEDHSFHSDDMAAGDLNGWTFQAGGAANGEAFAITVVAAGSVGGDIVVTTSAAHGFSVGNVITQVNLSDSAYVDVFIVNKIISSTKYEVTAAFTATGTGQVHKADALICGQDAAGIYLLNWSASASGAGANTVFDFDLHHNADILLGTRVRRKFGSAGDVGAVCGTSILRVEKGEYISFLILNVSNATNISFVNFNLNLIRQSV